MVNTTRSKAKGLVAASAATSKNKAKHNEKKGWNTMSHLFLKRFADNDPTLTPGAKRDRLKHPHFAVAQLDPSGRAQCKLCGKKIQKSALRFGLYLECHKGYRNLCTLHPDCFWEHPETKKLEDPKEIHFASELDPEQRATIKETFDQMKQAHDQEESPSTTEDAK